MLAALVDYVVALGAATRAMADAAINKRLRRRVLTFQASTLSCAPTPLAMSSVKHLRRLSAPGVA